MNEILKDINAVIGVTGSFVCDDTGRVLAKEMPAVFDENMLAIVGRTMAQTLTGLKTAHRRKIGDMDLVYEQGRLIIKSLNEGCLCILCVCRINVPLLNLTANIAVKKLEQKLKEPRPASTAQPAPATPPASPPTPPPTGEPQQPPAETAPKRTRAEILAATLRR